jgi:hypothetical protein
VEALIPISMFMCIAAVMILRPITKKIGGLLEVMTRDRSQVRSDDAGNARIAALMEHMTRRLDHIEERLDFTERLVSTRNVEPRRPLHRLPRQDAFDGLDSAQQPEYLRAER